ncbi:hypothetical protein BTN33_12695 [Aeromonas veronii]|uniref:hypothetical protein n=1 Tax=Aeromonas veronii TaxID=654 RepID=UPI000946C9BB|nr:hypothetical protein [Aeromonas veronii]OLF58444.1 hypothetical protein BTN33_12695 [Aeromonas veronii]
MARCNWQLELYVGLNVGEQYFAGGDFDDNALYVDASFKPFGNVTLGAYIKKGDQIDYENVQLDDQWLFSTRVDWQVSRYFTVDVKYTHQSLDVPGGELFEANLVDLRLTNQFNSRNKLALTVQESDIHQNLSLGTQLIYSYKINAKPLVYLGYSDNAVENDGLSSYYKTGRTLFAKFSYMFLS